MNYITLAWSVYCVVPCKLIAVYACSVFSLARLLERFSANSAGCVRECRFAQSCTEPTSCIAVTAGWPTGTQNLRRICYRSSREHHSHPDRHCRRVTSE